MIQTMAVKITKKTYPIAVACLAAGFATIPMERVLGCYLIINEVEAKRFKGEGERPYLTIGNSWSQASIFNKKYAFADGEVKNTFAAVIEK